jgi:anti-sigma B factor antagonist
LQQPGLIVTVTPPPAAVLSATGELDIATAPVLREAFLALLKQDPVPDVTFEAGGLSFVDSSGLAVLLMVARRWNAEGRSLLVRPSAQLTKVIDLAGVRRAFQLAE